jgi:GGDEF domain-containing protein
MFDKIHNEILFQDIGLLAFLASIFCCMAVIWAGGTTLMTENFIMLLITVIAVILVTFSVDIAAFVTVGSQIICFTAYKLFFMYTSGASIEVISFAWLILPPAAVFSMKVFCIWRNRLELENSMLRKQVEELVVIDPLTELYNLRSFYHDLPCQISYIKRNKLPLTLMIIRLRYAQELRHLLLGRQYDMVRQRLSQIALDAIRTEDRLYSIGKDGDLAVILTCEEQGGMIVRNRIRAKVSEKDAFSNIAAASIKVDVQIAYMQYNEETYSDAMGFKTQVENELQYDV